MSRVDVRETEVFTFEELSDKAKQKVLEKFSSINIDYDWWEFDGQLDLSIKEMEECGISVEDYKSPFSFKKLYFDLDRGAYIHFQEIEIANIETARKFLQIPLELWDNLNISFENKNCNWNTPNTKLVLEKCDMGMWYGEMTEEEIEERIKAINQETDKFMANLAVGFGDISSYQKKVTALKQEYSLIENKIIDQAIEIFSDKVHEAWVCLRDSYEYMTSEEAIIETIKINDYEFTEDGRIY